MRLLVLDRQDRTARVIDAARLAAMARSPDAIATALKRFARGFPAIVRSPTTRARGWKIVDVLRGA